MDNPIQIIDDICRAHFELFIELRKNFGEKEINELPKIERYIDELIKIKTLNG